MSGDHAEDQVSNLPDSVGDHQKAAQAGRDPNENVMTLAAAIKLAQQASQPRKVSAPPPLMKVQSGPSYAGRYVPPLFIDPANVTALDGFEEHKGYINVAVEAFSLCHVGLTNLGKAREQVAKDPSKTEAQQVLILAGEAEKLQNRMTRAMDKARTTLLDGINHNEETLSKPIKAAADNSVSAEVRAHCKNLPNDGARLSFLNDALKRNDRATLSAILGAQPFLSGIKDYMQKEYTRMLHEKNHPEIAARITTMRGALEMVEQRGGAMITEVEKALGARWDIVSQLRKTQDASAQALLLINQVQQQ